MINCIKAEIALRLTRAGQPPKVLSAAAVVGAERAVALFESAYDEHARQLAKLPGHAALETRRAYDAAARNELPAQLQYEADRAK